MSSRSGMNDDNMISMTTIPAAAKPVVVRGNRPALPADSHRSAMSAFGSAQSPEIAPTDAEKLDA